MNLLTCEHALIAAQFFNLHFEVFKPVYSCTTGKSGLTGQIDNFKCG